MESIARYLAVAFTQRTVAELPARFAGPAKKKKTDRKTPAKRRKSPEEKARTKAKQRHRVKKNIGKRRVPGTQPEKPGVDTMPDRTGDSGIKRAGRQEPMPGDGLAPLKRK